MNRKQRRRDAKLKASAPDDILAQAMQYHRAGKLGAATDLYNRILADEPGHLDALHMLADIHRSSGQPAAALPLIQTAAAISPDHHVIQLTLGNVLASMGDTQDAEAAYSRAVEIDPAYAEGYYNLANLVSARGAAAEAEPLLRKAVEFNPDFVAAHNNLAIVLKDLGRIEDAANSFSRALEIDPNSGAALYGVSQTRKFAADAPEIAAGERILGSANLDASDRINVHFALGKMYDDCGNYAAAFENFTAANRLKGGGFDRDRHAKAIEAMIASDTAGAIRDSGDAGNFSKTPVFVLGMPRSGTSLVEQIIASHSDAFGVAEMNEIAEFAATHPGADDARDFAPRYLNRLAGISGGARRVVDKAPWNYLYIGLIATVFPRARIIHCVRDPLDTCLSCYFQNFTSGHDYTADFGDLGFVYRAYQRLMAHWQSVSRSPILEVRYEDLVARQEETSRALIAFCGLEWDPDCLGFHNTVRAVNTASSWQVRRPLYASSTERWRNYADYLGPLRAALNTPVEGKVTEPVA